MSSTVSGPGHLPHRWPVGRAVDPWGVSLEEDLGGSHVEPTPPPSPLTTVIPGGPRSARSASTSARSSRPHMGHQNLRLDIELDVLDHHVLEAQQGAPYAGVLHAVLRSAVSDLRQARNLDGERRVAVQALSLTHRYDPRASFDDASRKRSALAGSPESLQSTGQEAISYRFLPRSAVQFAVMAGSATWWHFCCVRQ